MEAPSTDTPENSTVVGIYSFPKSGNTWVRAIIAAIVGVPNERGALHKYVTDTHYGRVIENPWVFQGRDWYFYKSHFKKVMTEHKGQSFYTDKIIYIYRHPLDVFVSYLNFVSQNVASLADGRLPFDFETIDDLSREQMEFLFSRYLSLGTIFPKNTHFGSVIDHVSGFRALAEERDGVHLLRYEDLSSNFTEEADKLCDALGLTDIDIDIVFQYADKATAKDGKFFWRRSVGTYREYLTTAQIDRFYKRYGPELEKMGYDRDAG